MKLEGYKLNGYDATYNKAVFEVAERGTTSKNRVLEITELESGITFLLELDSASGKNRRTSKWRKEEVSEFGKTIHFGKAGFLEQLKYNNK